MGTGYTRNDTSNNISDGNIINASDLDGEFDAIVTAFSTSGHTHDGTTAEGGPVTVVGPAQDLVVSATQVLPKTTGTLNIGSDLLEFQDIYIDGTAYIDGLGRNVLVATDKKIEFRSASNAINSSAVGQLDIDAGTEVEITTTTLDVNASTTDLSGTLTVGSTLTASNGGSLTGTWSNLGTVTTVVINGGTITGITDITVADGGTGASTASGARTNLGLVIGTDVQAYDAGLADIAGLAVTDGNIIVGDGTNWVAESGATARTSLGLAIGTNVQAWDADLDTIAGLAKTDSNFIVGNGTAWVVESGATARTSLGLGSIATQAASAVAITGGTINGTTIGATTAAAGTFTSLTASGAASVGSLSSSGAVSGTSLTSTGAISGTGITGTSLNITGTTVTGVLDEDTMVSNSASKLATQQSIKAYVDTEIAGINTTIAANSITATELNVTGNGTTTQFLRSDGDGSFTWAVPVDTNTTYSAGSGITLTGTTFSNAAPDQTVSLTGSGATSVSGTYPNFTISSTDTDTNTTYSAGTGLSLSGTTFNMNTGHLDVGTYATLFYYTTSSTTGLTAGSTYSSANGLRYGVTPNWAGDAIISNTSFPTINYAVQGSTASFGSSPSGTWRLMGAGVPPRNTFSNETDTYYIYHSGLFQRIS